VITNGKVILMRRSCVSVLLVSVTAAIASPALADVSEGIQYVFGATPSGVQTLTINGNLVLQAFSTGWYAKDGAHDASNANYLAGSIQTNLFHDYFAFDLSSVSGPVRSAELSIGQGPAIFFQGQFEGGFESEDQTALEFVTHDVSTPASRLMATQTDATDIYADLGSGSYYGAVQTDFGNDGKQVSFALNRNALADIEADEGGTFAVGGKVAFVTDPLPASPPPVPLPASLPLFGGALAVTAGLRLRRRLGSAPA
jgi:hypothetical protein